MLRLVTGQPIKGWPPKSLVLLKFTLILILSAAQVSANGYAQNTVTLSEKNAPIIDVLRKIQRQTGYSYFGYGNANLLVKAEKVTIKVKDALLTEALDLIFKSGHLSYIIEGRTIIISKTNNPVNKASTQLESAKKIDVHGRVVNENGEPIPGVSVSVKGTEIMTSTNDKGEFSISVSDDNASLVFTSVNMETSEVRLNGKSEISISLKTKITSLKDITISVNTGYQQQSKERSTGSFEHITNEELSRRVGSDILSRIEGTTPGILFDKRKMNTTGSQIDAASIIIRGLSTITDFPTTVKTPLIILNNFPYEGDINNINPNDVESITILKDAAAASIWGARAGNGVIVITTKQGKYTQQNKMSINSNIIFNPAPDLFYYNQMSSSDFIDVETFLFKNGFYNSDLNNTTTRPAMTPVAEILARRRSGLISASDSANLIDALRSVDVRRDFEKYIYRNSLNQQYSLNFTGGSDRIRYALLGGFDNNRPNLIGNSFQRQTLRSDLALMATKNLEIQLAVGYTNSVSKNNSLGDYGGLNYTYRSGKDLYPYATFADAGGNHLALAKDYRAGYTDTAGGGKLLDWKFRPLDELNLNNSSTKLTDVLINIGIKYNFSRSLSAEVKYQAEQGSVLSESIRNEASYYTRDLINLFTQIQGNTIIYKVPLGGILERTDQRLNSKAGRAQINYSVISGRHSLTALAGSEIRHRNSQSNSSRRYGYKENSLTTGNVDHVNSYPRYGNRGNGFIPGGFGMVDLTDRFVSLYSNAAYTYDKRYTFSGSIRRDGSNLFGVDMNNKWKPFWSVGGAWDISSEKFFKVAAIPYLRLRLTYGYQGNVNNSVPPYTIMQYVTTTGSLTNQPFAIVSNPGNPDLSWEKIGQINASLDFKLSKNRIQGSFEFFKKKSTDLILSKFIDPTTGIGSVKANSADMETKGIDVSLTTLNLNKALKWTTDIFFSYASTKVTDYSLEDKNSISGYISTSGFTILPKKGRSPYGIHSLPFAGLDPTTGDPLGYKNKIASKDYIGMMNQRYDTADFIYHGSALPLYFGSVNNHVSFKGLTLTASISYKFAYFFRKRTISYYSLYNSGSTHPDFEKRWKTPGDENITTIPSMIYPISNANRDNFYAYSSINVLKGDNIRLEFIRLSYDLTGKILAKTFIKKAQCYLYAGNLGFIWRANDQKLDPDFNTGNAIFPPAKNFSIGLRFDL